MMDYNTNKKYFDCGLCGDCTTVRFSLYDDYDECDSDDIKMSEDRFSLNIKTFIDYGTYWKNRLMAIWDVIKYGEHHYNDSYLNLSQMKDLNKYLNKLIKDCDKKIKT